MIFLIYNTQVYVKGVFFLAKQSSRIFLLKINFRAKKPLQFIYINVYGPIAPTSFGKRHSFLTFIDNYTRKF